MQEHRSQSRRRTFKGGLISGGNITGMECTIRNMSERGALLEVSNPAGIPDVLTLIIKPEIVRRTCVVAWRSGIKIGVKFK
ncbi:MAG: PilZ domain-containing protein [Pseudomonadota bacterium]